LENLVIVIFLFIGFLNMPVLMPAIPSVPQKPSVSLKSFMPFRKEDLVKRIGDVSSKAHEDVVDAMFSCVGLRDENFKKVTLRPKTGEFEFVVDRPLMGRAQPTSKEAPGGVILQLGFNPMTGKGETVKGRVDKEGIQFFQGVSSYVISAIDNLEGANRTMAKMVTMMPKFMNRKIFKNAGFDYDSKDGSLAGPVQVTGFAFKGDKILESFSLFGGGNRKPSDKESSFIEIKEAWKKGEPLPANSDYKEFLRARYREAMAAGRPVYQI